jgi:hypothetical protein
MPLLYPNPASLVLANTIQAITTDCKIGLFQNELTLTPEVVFTDLTLATFSGYTLKTITLGFGEAYYAPTGNGAEIRSGEQQFNFVTPTLPTLPVTNTIFGYYVQLSDDTLLVVGTFDPPIAMVTNGDACFVNVVLGFGANP